MKLKPIHDRVLVKRDEVKKKIGLLHVPDTAQKKKLQGTVVAAGKGRIIEGEGFRALDVKEDDRVMFGEYAGTEVTVDGEKYLMLREEDILAVFED